MTPTVRGERKLVVAVALLGSSTASGALAGFAAGAAWAAAPLGATPAGVVAALGAAAVAADLAHQRGWAAGPRPWSVGRQVPQIWSRLFSLPTVALLYGARLGTGPLTILPTWLWWAAAVSAASLGPLSSAAVGGWFGAVRILVMLGVAEWLRHDTPARMARLRAVGRLVGAAPGVPTAPRSG